MNRTFIDFLTEKLIEKKDYIPIREENGEIPEFRDGRILERLSYGSNSILEILDGDSLSSQDIETRLSNNSNALLNMERDSCLFFEVVVFSSQPDEEKLEAIKSGQYQKYPGKKYLACITVDLESKKVNKHYKLPLSSGGLEKVIGLTLSQNWQEGAQSLNLEELARKKEEEAVINFVADKPYLSYILIALNVIVLFAIYAYGLQSKTDFNLLLNGFGAKNNLSILSGEYWRFVTPIFLHADIMHLALNCYSLYAVGFFVERLFGHGKFIFVYFTAGIIGNIASFMFSINPGVGASGAIFGLLGALLYYGLENPSHFKRYFGHNVVLMIVLNVGYGFSRTGIDNYAHLGGLLGGFLASGAIRTKRLSVKLLSRFVFIVLTITVILGGLLYGFNNEQNTVLYNFSIIEKESARNSWIKTEKTAEEILRKSNREDVRLKALFYAAQAEIQLMKNDEAAEHGKEMLKLDPMWGHYILGISYFNMGQYEESRQELLEAKRLKAEFENIDQILKEIDQIMGK